MPSLEQRGTTYQAVFRHGFVKQSARQPFIHPMFVFAAHTGARRSEMVRSEIDDFDFVGGTVLIREKKRVRGKLSTRRVPLSPLLVETMRHWFANHPGGRYAFALGPNVPRSGKTRELGMQITRDAAYDHFKRTLAGSKWDKLRGWHVFRNSFCSNSAAKFHIPVPHAASAPATAKPPETPSPKFGDGLATGSRAAHLDRLRYSQM